VGPRSRPPSHGLLGRQGPRARDDILFGDECGTAARLARSLGAAAGDDGNDRLHGGRGNHKLYGSPGAEVRGAGPVRTACAAACAAASTVARGATRVRADAPDRLRGCEPIRSQLAANLSPLTLLSTDAHRRRWRSAAPAYSRHPVVVEGLRAAVQRRARRAPIPGRDKPTCGAIRVAPATAPLEAGTMGCRVCGGCHVVSNSSARGTRPRRRSGIRPRRRSGS
jgi:hypothetical protein